MKSMKKLLSISLAVLLVAGTAITAQAKSYNVADGNTLVVAYKDGQEVYTAPGFNFSGDPSKDTSPVISGSSDQNIIALEADDGKTAELTLNNVTLRSAFGLAGYTAPIPFSLFTVLMDGSAILNLRGSNTVFGPRDFNLGGVVFTSAGTSPANVSIRGDGSLTAVLSKGDPAGGSAITVSDVNLSVEGGSLTGVAPSGYGVALYGESTLTVSEDYLHPASVTASGGEAGFLIQDDSRIIIGENNFVFDENGRDITAQVLANPELLKTLKYVIISTKDIAVFPSDKMESNVHMMTAYKNTKFEQTGEPSAEAMKILSEGMNGEALYAGSFAFTDDIGSHGMFQLNIMLPQYAGRHVKLVTLENGKAVSYDRWVANDGMVWAHVDHLGDFAVFAA